MDFKNASLTFNPLHTIRQISFKAWCMHGCFSPHTRHLNNGSFQLRKCVNARSETLCMNRKTSMRWLSIKDDLSVVWRWIVQLPKTSMIPIVVFGNKVKVADSWCPTKSMTPVSYLVYMTAFLHRFYLHCCKVRRFKSNSLSTWTLLE